MTNKRFKNSSSIEESVDRIFIVLDLLKQEHGIAKSNFNTTLQKKDFTLKDLDRYLRVLNEISIQFSNLNDNAFGLALNQIPCIVKKEIDNDN